MRLSCAITPLLLSAFAIVGCANQPDDSVPQSTNSVGVSNPAPNNDPNNPTLTHKGVQENPNGNGSMGN
jgi:hypothetical protein